MDKKVVLPLAVRPADEESHAYKDTPKLYSKLSALLSEWQDHRKIAIEDKWETAYNNFKGEFDDAEHKGANASSPWRSKAFYPLTEQKVTAAQAQLQDVLFKGGKFPYDIKGSPIPDDPAILADANKVVHGGQMLTRGREVEQKAMAKEELDQRVKNMRKRMDDQFAECDAASIGLTSLYEGALYGTAFLESPRITRKKRYKWNATKNGDYSKTEAYEDVPTVVNLNPWDCWPDPECGGKVSDGIGFFHRERMSAPAINDLFELVFPSKDIEMKDADSEEYEYEYNKDQFEALLTDIGESDTGRLKTPVDNDGPNAAADTGHANKIYEVFNFAGAIQNKFLKEFIKGIKGKDNAFSEVIVVMCNARIIKCVLNPFPGKRRPYHMVPWTSIPGSAYGRGVAEKIFDAQKNVNRLMRMYIDNKRLSGNLMTAIDRSKLKRGCDLAVHPGKNWEFEGSFQDADVRRLLHPIIFPDVTGGVLEAIGTMVSWADQSSGVPKILEGQPGQDSSTAYAENQRISAATKQLGLVLKNYDMYAWVPIVESFYDWNMQYLKDNSVKGDFSVIATGFSTFENKHLRKLDLERFLMLSQQLPALQMKVKSDPIVEDWALAANLDPERYLLTEVQVADKMDKQQKDQLATHQAMMQMEQQKANMEHQFEIELKRVEQEMSGQIRMALAQLTAQTKQMSEETKRLTKLADIESREKQNDNRGNNSKRR